MPFVPLTTAGTAPQLCACVHTAVCLCAVLICSVVMTCFEAAPGPFGSTPSPVSKVVSNQGKYSLANRPQSVVLRRFSGVHHRSLAPMDRNCDSKHHHISIYE